ncbi:MAG TPA: tripartite tricarboxylate transporter substrate binding protein [Burkholderiales bacterium]|jgi:tripartite-type tricarboxylate transporter receptor subunit TctC
MRPFVRWIPVVLGLLAGAWPAVQCVAQSGANNFPNRPVRWIIPFPPGGSNDILGRYLGVKLGDRLGQQVVIDNRGGANGIIGAQLAAEASADGYIMLMISTSFVMNAAVRKLPYDIEKSFDPIATIGFAPNSIVVNPSGPYLSVKALVEAARAKPASIAYASTGVGGFNHFGGELFKKVAGIDMIMVPYKGGGPAMVDVMANQIPVMFSSVTQALPHVRAGRLKFIAVGGKKRSPVVPDVPTVIESGYPDYELSVWWGIAAPAGAPRANLDKLRSELAAVLEEPSTKKRLLNEAAEPLTLAPADMRKKIRDERKKWSDVAKQAGIVVK